MHEHRPLCLHLLGALEVWAGGERVPYSAWRTTKNMDLLRLLALSNGSPIRRDSLIEKLWPDAKPDRARHSLRTAASQLRHALGGPCIERVPEGLVLRDAWVDVEAFESLVRRAVAALRDGRPGESFDQTRAADAFWAGPFEAADDTSGWAVAERARLERLREQLYTTGALAALDLGHYGDAQELAARAVEIEPHSETAHRALIQAYAELGEVGKALRVFERYRTQLAEELGIDPSPETRELHLRLLRG